MMRTHRAGELRLGHVGTQVALCGWAARRRDHGGVVFLDLRDASGLVQVVVDPADAGGAEAHRVRPEWVLRVEGEVRPRPEGTANPDLDTGEVEVAATRLEVLNEAEPPPFPLDDRADVDEVLRLRHRYLDLRRARLQRNLRVRATVNRAVRQAMDSQGFVEVETPMLIASTPEGARDFVVPSRLSPGEFYALPQSPQLFKQMLMVGGLDRYYQIARCLRDEDLRADRQFEFMQLDAELSFGDQDDVIAAISEAVLDATEAVTGERPGPIPRMPWTDAMERYGTDKPDLRIDAELVELTEAFAGTSFRAFQAEAVKGISVPGGAALSRNRLDALVERARALGAAGLVWMRVGEGDELDSPVAKFVVDDERRRLLTVTGSGPGDLVLIVAGERATARRVLGQLRVELFGEIGPAADEGVLRYVWVVDFPLFEGVGADGRPVPAHHPFTMPHPDDVERLEAEPLAVRSQAYDLVCNGWELGSGSVRIHRPDLQQRVLALLGIGAEESRERFGFLLDAFRFGAPPHAGFAFGMDRLAAILSGEENIREVIAFPKTQSGADPLTGAPSPIDAAHLAELGLRVARPPGRPPAP